jgi:two-component system cell cycle sensor histidine kinase/response regulator CckA
MTQHLVQIFFWIISFIIWSSCLIVLGSNATNSTQWICLLIITIMNLILGIVLVQWSRQRLSLLNHIHFHRSLLNHLQKNQDVCLFDHEGQMIVASDQCHWSNISEFCNYLNAKVVANEHLHHVLSAIQQNDPTQQLLEGMSYSKNQKKWWWFNLDLVEHFSRPYPLTLVQMVDVSPFFRHYNQLQYNYNQLEKFLNEAPFSLIYVNENSYIIGVNSTFCVWIGQERGEILGQNVVNYTSPSLYNFTHIDLVTLITNKGERVRCLCLPMTLNQGNNKAFILYKIQKHIHHIPINDHGIEESTFLHARIPAILARLDGSILDFNPAFLALIGSIDSLENASNRISGSLFDLIEPRIREDVLKNLERSKTDKESVVPPFEVVFQGGLIHTTVYVSQIQVLNKEESSVFLLQFIDISEQKRLEEQFIQSQKMQAVGQLAGGVAHDFNNLLTAILGFCDLLLQRYMPNDPSYNDVIQIKQNANRAANLVRQLLAFSRQQTLQPKIVSITDTLSDLSILLRRLIGSGIELEVNHERDLWSVKADIGQLEQVVVNLAVNARDAMSGQGKLIIRTSNFRCNSIKNVIHDIMPSGDYVLVEIIDNGHGIKPEVIERIFEPFFSTKEVGLGTGLGLSTVYGIVKQTGGFVEVKSTVGKGSTFGIYLPRFTGAQLQEKVVVEQHFSDLTGSGTILLVEDEDPVRICTARALREKGYKVIECNGGEEALEWIATQEHFDILITDVVMPKIDGPTLNNLIREKRSGFETIFISGYTEDTFRSSLRDGGKIHFLAKPFSLKDLAAKIKEVTHEKKDS